MRLSSKARAKPKPVESKRHQYRVLKAVVSSPIPPHTEQVYHLSLAPRDRKKQGRCSYTRRSI